MRIVMVGAGMIPIPPPDYGAVEKHIWNLSQALEKLGHEVVIVNEVVGPRSVDEYRFALRARRRLASLRRDVLHVHTPGVAAVFSALGPRRFVYTTHSRHWATRDGWGERVGFALERQAVRRAAAAIAVSPMVGAEILALGVRGHVVPNGVDLARYAPDRHVRKGNRLVGLGEIAPHKAWHVAAAAVKGLPAQLVLIGPIRDAAYATKVEEAAPGQVTLLGVVDEDELARLLAEADVQVHPSVSESFGMAVVEGMASGLPVVASDVVASLVEDGVNGFLVPARLPDEERVARFRRHLEMLLSDMHLRRLQGEASRMKSEAYGWESVARRVADVYANVAGGDAG